MTDRQSRREWFPQAPGLGFWLAAEMLALILLNTPGFLQFKWFGFADQGAELAVHRLLSSGYRPTLDFAHIYGLLPLLAGRGWYAVWGRTPAAFLGAAIVANLLMVWGLTRFARALQVRWPGCVLLAASLPHLVRMPATLTHAIEPVLIVHALAEQARGKHRTALALVTACAFVKPSMAYVYGLLLVALVLARAGNGIARYALRMYAPAVLTGLTIGLVLAAVFGYRPLVNTLLPLAGSRVYAASHFGFFRGIGRDFWNPAGAGPGYYLGTVAGFWLAGTAVLLAGAPAASWRSARSRSLTAGDEAVITCALLHAAFVAFFFGNAWSWSSYSYLLVMGLAAFSARGRPWDRTALVLAALALLGAKSSVSSAARDWSRCAYEPTTAGLWATPEQRVEWAKVRELTGGRPAALLAYTDGATVLFPNFEPPAVTYLLRGMALPQEIARKAEQVERAPTVVVTSFLGESYDRWPEFATALEGCSVVWEGKHFRVYRREANGRSRSSRSLD